MLQLCLLNMDFFYKLFNFNCCLRYTCVEKNDRLLFLGFDCISKIPYFMGFLLDLINGCCPICYHTPFTIHLDLPPCISCPTVFSFWYTSSPIWYVHKI
uniref:Uncharacterized protein n=1 Tax=Cucumis melo TaxID=3656 RepID=A0A9I9EDB5_CUCME